MYNNSLYKSFQELKDHAEEMARAHNLIGTTRLSVNGKMNSMMYHFVTEAFSASKTKTDVIEQIRAEIDFRENLLGLSKESLTPEYRENKAVVFLLGRYIRKNFEPELWESIPEFQLRS